MKKKNTITYFRKDLAHLIYECCSYASDQDNKDEVREYKRELAHYNRLSGVKQWKYLVCTLLWHNSQGKLLSFDAHKCVCARCY